MIEKLENNHWIGRTLNPETVWNWCVSTEKQQKMSIPTKERKTKSPKNFAQPSLNEPSKMDTKVNIPDFRPVDIDKLVPDIELLTKKILGEQ